MTETTKTEESPTFYHFHLVTGIILFSEGEEDANLLTVSAIVKGIDANFDVARLVKAQRNLQAVFFQKAGNPNFKVRDVTVTNVSPLAYATEKSFYALPDEITQTLKTDVGDITEADVIRTPDQLAAALKQ